MRKHSPTSPLAPLSSAGTQRGAALIIVLAFVVLLTVLVLAFFSQTRSYQNLANSSFNDFKSTTLGQSALQVVIGDLQQEIVTSSSITSLANGDKLYTPLTAQDTVPRRYPTLSVGGTDLIPNLIRISSGSDSSALHPASSVSSTTPALNGQYVSSARWNKHYLIPRDPSYGATQVGTNPDPNCNFTAPSWIYVTGTGPIANPGTHSPIIGRYAYAIFNEGGLLDINVAGHPSTMPAKQTNSGTTSVWGYANKGSEAFANLATLGLLDGEIDDIVGWRNYASAQATGDLNSGYKFPDNGKRYYDFIQSNTNGFLQTGTLTYNNITDQPFTSRQQLIKFFTSGSFQLNTLQYLATFTRDTDQPSFTPNPNRPKIQSTSSTNSTTYGTGNDAKGQENTINPAFLSVRVAAPFTRNDGSTAQIGEPLVKKRFSLSKLSLVEQGSDSTSIAKYFGLTRSGNVWTYNHGNASAIMTLSQVAAAGREPDFFELLKAAINIGSIGKSLLPSQSGYTYTSANSVGYLQHNRDVKTDLQIIQIGANIIDQYDSDSFSTRIQFSGTEIRGIEDLPYLYRMRNWIMRNGPGGTGSLLLLPEIWNPHDPASSTSVTNAPQNFRIRLARDSSASSNATPLKIAITYYNYSTGNPGSDAIDSNSSGFITVNLNDPAYGAYGYTPNPPPSSAPPELAMTFSTSGSNFREPTLLAQPGLPAASALSGSNYVYDTSAGGSGGTITGFRIAQFMWLNPNASSDSRNVIQQIVPAQQGSNSCLHLYLEYQQGGQWVVYDEAPYMPYTGNSMKTEIKGNINQINFQQFSNPYNNWYYSSRTDPRTSRWAFVVGEYTSPNVSPTNMIGSLDGLINPVTWTTMRPTAGKPYGTHISSRSDNGQVGSATTYSGDNLYYGFQHGYWAENTVRKHPQDAVAEQRHFNYDPDGIARRAMGGYAADPLYGGSDSQTIGLPMATGNYASRPLVLNRPFRSIGELGYVFRETPWGNINFSFPESGDAALLDVFCINENNNDNALVAGRLDLNTRQPAVIASLVSGALRDESNSFNVVSQAIASSIGNSYASYVTNTHTMTNRADLVGTWTGTNSTLNTPDPNNPSTYYSNFTGFISNTGTISGISGTEMALITRQHEAVIRALADCGTSRTWNLLIDLVAQSGRFSPGAANLNQFTVEGEKHYWLHVAIDRFSGKVIDSQLEIVNE